MIPRESWRLPIAGAWELMTAAVIDAERNSLRIDKHRHRPADDRRDILDGDEQLHEVMRAWGSRPDAALNSFSATTVDAAIVHRIVRVNRPIEDLPIKRDWARSLLIALQDMVAALSEEAILPPTARGTARPSGVQGKEKAMIGAVRITKVDALSENFAC